MTNNYIGARETEFYIIRKDHAYCTGLGMYMYLVL